MISVYTTYIPLGMAGKAKPAAPISIVDPSEIIDDDQIRSEVLRLTDLGFGNNVLEAMQWLVKRRLLHNGMLCQECKNSMKLYGKQNSDGYMWNCRDCGLKSSIRKDSFCSKSRLSLQQIVIIMYCWARDYPQKDIAHEAQISVSSTHTLPHWCNFCRVVCRKHFDDPKNRVVHEEEAETMWKLAQQKLRRQHGTSDKLFESYMHEFVWRHKFRDSNLFAEFLICLREQYPV